MYILSITCLNVLRLFFNTEEENYFDLPKYYITNPEELSIIDNMYVFRFRMYNLYLDSDLTNYNIYEFTFPN